MQSLKNAELVIFILEHFTFRAQLSWAWFFLYNLGTSFFLRKCTHLHEHQFIIQNMLHDQQCKSIGYDTSVKRWGKEGRPKKYDLWGNLIGLSICGILKTHVPHQSSRSACTYILTEVLIVYCVDFSPQTIFTNNRVNKWHGW